MKSDSLLVLISKKEYLCLKAKGKVLLYQGGNEGHWLYLITECEEQHFILRDVYGYNGVWVNAKLLEDI